MRGAEYEGAPPRPTGTNGRRWMWCLHLSIYRYLRKKVMSNRPQSCKRNAHPSHPLKPTTGPPRNPQMPTPRQSSRPPQGSESKGGMSLKGWWGKGGGSGVPEPPVGRCWRTQAGQPEGLLALSQAWVLESVGRGLPVSEAPSSLQKVHGARVSHCVLSAVEVSWRPTPGRGSGGKREGGPGGQMADSLR